MSALKVIQPICAFKVGRFEQRTVRSVVSDFPTLVIIVEAKYLRCFIVVEIVLTDELSTLACIVEYNNGISINALSHKAVAILRSSLIGRYVIIQLYKFNVVSTFRGCHISLECEHRCRKIALAQDVFIRMLSVNGKAILKFNLVVLSFVSGRGCTLYINLSTTELEALAAVCGINIVTTHSQLVALVSGKSRAGKHKVRKILRQIVNHYLTICIKYIVLLPSVNSVSRYLHFCIPVIYDLITSQVIIIHSDAVQVCGTLI